jgi:ATP-binding cassette subfamily B protein
LFVLLTPLPLKIAVDSVVGDHPLPGFIAAFVPQSMEQSQTGVLLVAAGLFLLIPLLKQLQQFGNVVLTTYAGEKLLLQFRTRLFGHAERLSLAYHDLRGTSDSTYRIQYDATAIQNIAIAGLIPFFTATVTVAGMIYVTARIDWQLALVSLAIAPVLFGATRIYRKRLRSQWHDAKRLESSALSVVQESLEALRVVKAFGREDHARDRFADRSAESVRAKIGVAFVEGRFGIIVGATLGLGMATVLFLGTRKVLAGAMTLGELVLVIGYLEQLYEPLKTASRKVGTLQSSLASAERVYSLLDQAPDFVDPPGARPLQRAAGAVAFRNVSFAYESGHRVLHDVSFEVAPGTRLGIAGTTGAGKTTLVSLLTRFYDPSAGQILLDGVDLREYKLADLRNQFAIVLQEPVLFSTSIAENIAYARPDAGDDDIVAAAKAAGAHDFILALPDGYDTPVGERGVRLSGGERQRIALARAFLKDAPILILDEPTSSVDVQTEAQILEAMKRLMRGRTAFMIAHRLSTLEICDARIELEHGRVAVVASGDAAEAPRERLSIRARTMSRTGGYLHGRNGAAANSVGGRSARASASAPALRANGQLPPQEVVDLARHLVAGPDERARLLVHEPLKKSVYRLRFEVLAGPVSVVVKRLSPRIARANELVAQRWLPAVGLEWACPGLRGVVLERSGSKVWHIYEDVPGTGLDDSLSDPGRVGLVVELIVDLHTRFAGHALLPQCRKHGEELGMGFFGVHVGRSIDALKSIGSLGPPLPREQEELRDRLLGRVERLYAERDKQASLLEKCGVPDTLLHGDLWLTNTLVGWRADGFQATLIDWDHVGVGPVTYDLSTFLYRLAPEHRPSILARYREAAARRGWHLPDDPTLNQLFETAECARYASCLGPAAVATSRGESWGFEMLAEIDTWFARLQPALTADGGQ